MLHMFGRNQIIYHEKYLFYHESFFITGVDEVIGWMGFYFLDSSSAFISSNKTLICFEYK